jgi:hypothetical protein
LQNYFQSLEKTSAAFCDAEGGSGNPEMEGENSWGAGVTAQENAVVHSAPFAAGCLSENITEGAELEGEIRS